MNLIRLLATSGLFTCALFADIVNVALATNGGVAQQSSSAFGGGFPASRGIDGIKSFSISDLTHTDSEFGAWWQVTFDQTYFITRAEIFNRVDCCFDRINPYSLFLFNEHNDLVWQSNNNTFATATSSPATFSGINAWGNRFRVQLEDTNWLHLREVEVFADLDGVPPSNETVVPEPSTYAILAAGVLGVALRHRKMRRAAA